MREMKWLGTLVVVLCWPALATAAPGEGIAAQVGNLSVQAAPSAFDDEAPDRDWVWVDGHVLKDGTVHEGFYRIRSRNNFMWIEGKVQEGTWHAPHWEPMNEADPGTAYVRGHRGANGYWAQGYWRPETRQGFTWTETTTSEAGTVAGHWVPVDATDDKVWVPGHPTAKGDWIDGFWRQASWTARRWVPGSWRYGVYHRGHWAPNKPLSGKTWVGGHNSADGWKAGHWRSPNKAGSYWQRGHWTAQGWSPGSWVEGRRPVVARHFRVVPVGQMKERRAQKRTVWAPGSGVSAKKRGKTPRKRGKRSRKKKPRKAW